MPWADAIKSNSARNVPEEDAKCRHPIFREKAIFLLESKQEAMKTSTDSRRRTRRSPWSAKNFRLLRAALKVWELKRRERGNW
jgi:hypothetical protein